MGDGGFSFTALACWAGRGGRHPPSGVPTTEQPHPEEEEGLSLPLPSLPPQPLHSPPLLSPLPPAMNSSYLLRCRHIRQKWRAEAAVPIAASLPSFFRCQVFAILKKVSRFANTVQMPSISAVFSPFLVRCRVVGLGFPEWDLVGSLATLQWPSSNLPDGVRSDAICVASSGLLVHCVGSHLIFCRLGLVISMIFSDFWAC